MSNQPLTTDRAAPASHFAAVVPAAQTVMSSVSGTSVSGASGTGVSATTGTGPARLYSLGTGDIFVR